MVKIVGIRFRPVGKIYYFDPTNIEFKLGEHVIVETIRGIEYGTIAIANKEIEDNILKNPLKPIIRKATEEDDKKKQSNEEKEKSAFDICKEKIAKHELPMKLLDCEYTFDRAKLLFYFAAENRIDFRELVKDLASVFRTRIELRQVGVRDEAKILGGFGPCGREFCCASNLSEFSTVSIKMVKEQGLSLNPTKISGTCGRLMCCLKNEEEAYEELNQNLPNIGDKVTTNDGLTGIVHSISTLRQTVKVIVNLSQDDKEIREYAPSDLKFKKRKRIDQAVNIEEEREAQQLEALEKTDVKGNLDD